MSEPGPFALAAMTYLSRGLPPIPLKPRTKKPPLEGWTGYDAPYPSGADVAEWAANGWGAGNVAIRLPETVIGLDVDAYGDKPGAETFALALARLGGLPDTWSSTSREDTSSGILWFRVPAGRAWADTLGPGVEVIHHGHRYAVVAPSIHPDTGNPYVWVGPDGSRGVPGPRLSDLPVLPEKWVNYLDRGPAAERSRKASVTSESVSEALDSFPSGSPCRWLERVLEDAARELSTAGSRHDVGRHWVAVVVRSGEQGHHGSVEALAYLEKLWEAALASGEKRRPDHGEFSRMVEGAVAIVTESPTPEVDRGCCGTVADTSGLDFDPGGTVSASELEEFWSSRPVLAHIQTFARSRRCSPWSTLGAVLCRMAVRTRHEVCLPPLIGSYASLNLFVALVGESGLGKGSSESAAVDAVDFGEHLTTASVGSGEGILHLYAHREKGQIIQDRRSVLFNIPEVDTLSSLTNRQGATLLPVLRMAWSGEELGFAYADQSKALVVRRHEYRMGLILGVQPGRAGGLFADATGGTPQRFVWLPVADREMPAEPPPEPQPWKWQGFSEGTLMFNTSGLAPMAIPNDARELILSSHRERHRGEGDPLDGHVALCRLKVAAALALLDGRGDEVTDEDWSLSATVMRVSQATRDRVVGQLSATTKAANRARAVAEGERAVVVSETVDAAKVERVGRVILRALKRLGEGEGWVLQSDVRKAVASRDKDWYEAALEALIDAGKIQGGDGQFRLVV